MWYVLVSDIFFEISIFLSQVMVQYFSFLTYSNNTSYNDVNKFGTEYLDFVNMNSTFYILLYTLQKCCVHSDGRMEDEDKDKRRKISGWAIDELSTR